MSGGRGALIESALCAALVLAAACGGEKTGEGAALAGDPEPAAAKAVAKADAPATEAAVASRGIQVEGTATLIADSKPGAESRMRLVIGDAGRLEGALPIGGSECAIAGVVDEAIVRGWILCQPADERAPPRRGTLVGEKAGGAYSGTFAISDDGAATVLSGTWKAGK